MRILLVDDEKRILDLFGPLLEDFGHQVQTASGPDEALSLVSEGTFHIVFLDQCLGPVNGIDLMHQMNAVTDGLYYVIMTGSGSTDLAIEAMKKGASDFLSKPFFVNDMIKSIEYVGKKRALDQERNDMVLALETKAGEKEEELKNMSFSVLSSLAQAMEKKDTGTYGHSKRVSYYSRLTAGVLALGEDDRELLNAASLLHDIGKIGITDFILGKNGRLSPLEMQEVKNHPMKGVEILKPLRQFRPILPAILHHHEYFDGSGYPDGLAGEKIPLLARIITVCDAYDAILSDRPYRPASTHEKAVSELRQYSGRQFDPLIVKAFVEADIPHRMDLHGHDEKTNAEAQPYFGEL